nr:hypothetical protein Iba_chr04fCG9590 [Ipomoea batatas]
MQLLPSGKKNNLSSASSNDASLSSAPLVSSGASSQPMAASLVAKLLADVDTGVSVLGLGRLLKKSSPLSISCIMVSFFTLSPSLPPARLSPIPRADACSEISFCVVSSFSTGTLKPRCESSFVLAVPSSSNITFRKPHVSLSSPDLFR